MGGGLSSSLVLSPRSVLPYVQVLSKGGPALGLSIDPKITSNHHSFSTKVNSKSFSIICVFDVVLYVVFGDSGRKKQQTPTERENTIMTTSQTQAVDTTVPETVELSKSAKSDLIYAEELAKGTDGLRARCLTRFEAELGLKKNGGGSTYFQNCKTRASGAKVKHHYKPASKKTEQQADDDKETFGLALKDGSLKIFASQEEQDKFAEEHADQVAEDQNLVEEAQ